MLRLRKYLKKFWVGLLMVVALLYAQAQSELALPDYMSNIVSTGIQASGVTAVPEVISKDLLNHAKLFMSDEEVSYVEKNYHEVKSKEELPYEVSEKAYLNGLYVLDRNVSTNDEALNSAMNTPIVIASGIRASDKGTSLTSGDMQSMMEQIPEGMDVFDVLSLMPSETRMEMRDQAQKQMEVMGETSASIASAQMVKQEYELLDIDTQAIQMNYIWHMGLIMLAIALGGALCAILVGYFSSRIAAGVSRDMRRDVFNKVESFSNAEFNTFSTASLITRTTNDIQQIQMALVMAMRFVIYSPIMGVGAIIRVLDSDGSMIWIIAATVILIMLVISVLMVFVGPKFKLMQKLVDRLNLVMREQLSGMLVIRAFHNEEEESRKFEKANQDITKTQLFTSRALVLMMPIIMFIMNGVSLLIIWVGSHQVDLGTMQIGDMMAYIQYAMQIIMSFMFIAMMSIMLPRAGVAAKRVFEVMDMPLSIADPKEPHHFDGKVRGKVSFEHVYFRYPGAEEDVLSDITFEALPGQTTAFIGSTGSGKSTIINLVPRFFDVTKGCVKVDDIDIKTVTQHELRDRIGLVPQKGQLFAGTIASNIKYSDETMSDEQMMEAARIAQATEFIEQKPEGYNTEIAQGGTNVSGGQKQRISIARAIAKRPEILIFDDSFSALDFKTDAKLREALNIMCKEYGSTMLVVAQRISSIMHADQIVVLDEGRMAGIGTHEELMRTCPVYQEIAYSQLSKEELGNE